MIALADGPIGATTGAPIVTGYVISGTGSYHWALLVAGTLLLVGAVTCLTMTRDPISTEMT